MQSFDHDRLDAYNLARRLNVNVRALVDALPKGRSDLVDQLQRASASIALNIAEGSGEFTPKEKARFYRMAKRSATECVAILDLLQDLGLAADPQIQPPKGLLFRIVGLLVRHVRSFEQAPGTGTGAGRRHRHGAARRAQAPDDRG